MHNKIRVVVVEGNLAFQELIVEHISQSGFQVTGLISGEELSEHLTTNVIDVLVLDLQLPGEDGFSIAKRLRAAMPNLYIIILTAKISEINRVEGYKCGADIYLTKPTSPLELSSAIANIERRIVSLRQEKSVLTLDVQKMQLMSGYGETLLSAAELAILKALAEAPNQRLEYLRLMKLIEKNPTDKTKTALAVQIHRLKKKLLLVGALNSAIKSIHNKGYQLSSVIKLL